MQKTIAKEIWENDNTNGKILNKMQGQHATSSGNVNFSSFFSHFGNHCKFLHSVCILPGLGFQASILPVSVARVFSAEVFSNRMVDGAGDRLVVMLHNVHARQA